MTFLAVSEAAEPATLKSGSHDHQIRAGVWELLSSDHPHDQLTERRRDQRWPYPHLITLTPLATDCLVPIDEPLVVVGKQISDRGLGFFHPAPLPYRRVIASLEMVSGEVCSFVLELNWCRFTRHRWYESGGRFLQVVQPTDNQSGYEPIGS